MPQVDEKDIPELLKFLKDAGITVNHNLLAPELLRAHQRVDMRKVRAMEGDILLKPCLISLDYYVVDGNHRWWGHKLAHTPVPSLVISLNFDAALDELFKFPKTYSYGDGKEHNAY